MDEREKLYNAIARGLVSAQLDSGQIETVMSVVAVNLDKFEVQARSTELTTVCNDSDQLIRMYLQTILSEGKSVRTVKTYSSTYRLFLNETGRELRDVTTFDIRAWLAKVQMRSSKGNASNYKNQLSALFTWLYEEGVLSINPMDRIKTIKKPKVDKKAFSTIDIDVMRCNSSSVRQRAIVEVLLSSGVRIEEFCNLKISDVDFQKLTIHVDCGKGEKSRTTVIDSLAASCLKKYLASRKDTLPWLFVTDKGEFRKLKADTVRSYLKRMECRICVPDIHPHRFRRTFATTLYRDGVDLVTIQRLMGHSNISTTQRYIDASDIAVEVATKRRCN